MIAEKMGDGCLSVLRTDPIPRKQDTRVLNVLTGIAGCHKFNDIRLLSASERSRKSLSRKSELVPPLWHIQEIL